MSWALFTEDSACEELCARFISFKSSSWKLCIPMESRLIPISAIPFKNFWFKSSGFASKVISISSEKSKYFRTSSISILISSASKIDGVPPPKYRVSKVLFFSSLFLNDNSFLMAESISFFNFKEVEK